VSITSLQKKFRLQALLELTYSLSSANRSGAQRILKYSLAAELDEICDSSNSQVK